MTIPFDVYERLELRFLARHRDFQHYVDVPQRAHTAVCGLFVDSFDQWERNLDGHLAPVCPSCIRRTGEPWRMRVAGAPCEHCGTR